MNLCRLRRFRRSEDGSMSVEFALALPLLLWGLGALFVFVAAFEARATLTKATYTIADLYSRQTDPITRDFLEQTGEVLAFLTGPARAPRMRVSVVRCASGCDGDDRVLALDWSEGLDDLPAMTADVLNAADIAPRIPMLDPGNRVIVVESVMSFAPPLTFGLPARTFRSLMVVPPRFAPQLCWQSCGPAPSAT